MTTSCMTLSGQATRCPRRAATLPNSPNCRHAAGRVRKLVYFFLLSVRQTDRRPRPGADRTRTRAWPGRHTWERRQLGSSGQKHWTRPYFIFRQSIPTSKEVTCVHVTYSRLKFSHLSFSACVAVLTVLSSARPDRPIDSHAALNCCNLYRVNRISKRLLHNRHTIG